MEGVAYWEKCYFCNMKRETLFFELQYVCLCLMACSIPLDRRLFPPVFAVYGGLWILEGISDCMQGNFGKRIRRIRQGGFRTAFWILVSFYLCYLLALLWTENFSFAGTDLLLKLPCLLFPLFFFTFDVGRMNRQRLFGMAGSFVTGCFLYALYVVYVWLVKVDYPGFWSCTYVSKLVIHHSYLSMCYCLSSVFILYAMFRLPLCKLWRYLLLLPLLLLLFEVIFLSSRTAWIVTLLLLLVSIVYTAVSAFKHRIPVRIPLSVSLLFVAFMIGLLSIPSDRNRMRYYAEKAKSEGSIGKADAARADIWKFSLEVMKEHPVLGVGTGDVRDALEQKMQASNISYNAHNQYLNTWISCGILGMLSIRAILLYALLLAWRRKSFCQLLFLIIVAVNFLTEAVMERQLGVVFVSFFFCYFFYLSIRFLPENGEATSKSDS